VAEAMAGEMIVLYFGDELGREGLPFGAALGAPAAGSAGFGAGEAGRFDERFELFGERGLVGGGETGGKAHVTQQALLVIEAEQEGADKALFRAVAEAADHTIMDLRSPEA
jgi:hypothetical protein